MCLADLSNHEYFTILEVSCFCLFLLISNIFGSFTKRIFGEGMVKMGINSIFFFGITKGLTPSIYKQAVISNLALDQLQAIVVGFFAALIAMIMTYHIGGILLLLFVLVSKFL